MDCPMCHREVYSEMGKGCKVCGMVIRDKSKEFCSKRCRKSYRKFER